MDLDAMHLVSTMPTTAIPTRVHSLPLPATKYRETVQERATVLLNGNVRSLSGILLTQQMWEVRFLLSIGEVQHAQRMMILQQERMVQAQLLQKCSNSSPLELPVL